MKLDYKQYKITQIEFENMSAFDKRAYILQDLQEETMWWSRTANKIAVISIIIGFFFMFWAVANSGKGQFQTKKELLWGHLIF